MNKAIEAAARAVAIKHYSERFRKPADDPHVLKNAAGNWGIFVDDARAAIAAYEAERLDPEETISPYEWLAQEFDRLAVLRKMWTAHEVATMIRRHDIYRRPAAPSPEQETRTP